MSSKFVELANSLTKQQIIDIVTSLGADRYDDSNNNYIIFPTICHNATAAEASMKLYYYHNTHLFHCYTDCGDNFNIYDLFKRRYNLFDKPFNIYEIYRILSRKTGIDDFSDDFSEGKYESQKELYQVKRRNVELPVYDEKVMDVFVPRPAAEWVEEGITPETMKKFNIRYGISQNIIVIPHYNADGKLVGVRRRALNPEDIEDGKYKPIKVEQIWYSHPLALNLYGLNFTKDAINKSGKVVIFEGEKSVMLMDSYYGNDNNSVAICGSTLQRAQVEILFKECKIDEIIIALDKEYGDKWSEKTDKFFEKMVATCKKFNKYCSCSFIFDREGLLREKDSPVDRGKEVFEKLYNKRVKVRT